MAYVRVAEGRTHEAKEVRDYTFIRSFEDQMARAPKWHQHQGRAGRGLKVLMTFVFSTGGNISFGQLY